MKRRKQRRIIQSKRKKSYKCDVCQILLPSLKDYQKHVSDNIECKRDLPYSCQFCSYIGYEQHGFYKHLQCKATCQQFYKEKDVATGQMIDLSSCKVPHNASLPNQTSYQYKRFAVSGIVDTVQLNLTDNTLSNMDFQTQLDYLNKKKDTATEQSGYMSTSRIISSISNEILPLNDCFQYNHHDSNLDNMQLDNNNSEERDDTNHDTEIYDHIDQTLINNGVIDITEEQDEMNKRFSKMKFTHSDEASMDLFHIMKTSNVPLVMFDRIIRWLKRHEGRLVSHGTSGLLNRKSFIESMNNKLYTRSASIMKPKLCQTLLSSGRTSNVVIFSMKEMILRMVTNKSLFHSDNLLLNPTNPCADIPNDGYYGDVNSGTWFSDAKLRECSLPNHILMPFCHFIDGLSVDKYGKLTVEAVLTCCLWFNRKARNRSSSWWVHGFIEDQTLFRDQKNYVRHEKLQDYHDMMSKIFEEMKYIRDCGGIKLTLDFGKHGKHNVIAIPVIQYIIGDCKGNDTLCGRKGGHSLNMKGLCRDCNIPPDDGDNICIDAPLICKYITKNDIEGKSKEELEKFSFIPIHNCFSQLSFGGDPRGIYGGTPAEILHAVLLGLCDYIAEAIELMFTQTSMDQISHVVAGIYKDSRRQSERSLPNMSPFRNGLNSVAKLKAKERYARIYILFLALLNSYLSKDLCSRKRKKMHDNNDTPLITRMFLVKLLIVLKQTLSFHQWLKKERFVKDDFIMIGNSGDSRASKHIKTYLENFKQVVIRGGNGLKTPKFHQMLHVCDYIERHGTPLNYDGSRGENFGKVKIKDNAKLTRKQKVAFNFDIGRRISEEDIIDNASNIFQRNKGYWPSEYCNDTDIAANANRIQTTNSRANKGVSDKPRYKLICSMEHNENDSNIAEEINVHIDWGGQSKTPVRSYPEQLLKTVASRLYIGSPNIGGKVVNQSIVHGYTEITLNDNIYRCHPFYANTGSWYDWAYFKWEGSEASIPARILMILDLSECEISYEVDFDEDEASDIAHVATIPHLTKDKWVVVKAAESPSVLASELTDDHFTCDMITRIKLDEERIWLVPLLSLVNPCFVVYNRNYCDQMNNNDTCEHDSTAYIVKPMVEWSDCFLSPDLPLDT